MEMSNKSRRADTGLSDPGVIGIVVDCWVSGRCCRTSSCSCPPLPTLLITLTFMSNDLFGLLGVSIFSISISHELSTTEFDPSPSDSRSRLQFPQHLPMPALILHRPPSCLAGVHIMPCLRLLNSVPTLACVTKLSRIPFPTLASDSLLF